MIDYVPVIMSKQLLKRGVSQFPPEILSTKAQVSYELGKAPKEKRKRKAVRNKNKDRLTWTTKYKVFQIAKLYLVATF